MALEFELRDPQFETFVRANFARQRVMALIGARNDYRRAWSG